MNFDVLLAKLESGGPSVLVQKAQPNASDAHVNQPLNNIVVAYMQSANMVSDKVFPVVPVTKQSDLYYIYDIDTFYRDDAKPRAPATESAGGGLNFSTASYLALVEAYHKDIDDQLRGNADTVLQLDRAAAEFVAQKMVLRREARWLSTFFKSGVWTIDWTGVASASPTTNQFTQFDFAGADPRATIEAVKLQMLRTTGYKPNVAVISAAVMAKLVTVQAVKDQFKYTSSQSINEAMVAAYLGLDEVMITSTVSATGIEGVGATIDFQATGNAGGVKGMFLAYRATSPSILSPSAGYTFNWTGMGGGAGIQTTRMRAPLITSDRIESQMAYDFKIVSAPLGAFLSGCIA